MKIDVKSVLQDEGLGGADRDHSHHLASTRRHKSSLNHGQILRLLMCLGVHVFWLGDPSRF
jgi:hypothetical protein